MNAGHLFLTAYILGAMGMLLVARNNESAVGWVCAALYLAVFFAGEAVVHRRYTLVRKP